MAAGRDGVDDDDSGHETESGIPPRAHISQQTSLAVVLALWNYQHASGQTK